jgi:bacterioferritin-associated ferredoxin
LALDVDDFETHYHYQFQMILCLCKGVSDRTVRLTIAAGAASVEAVGAGCGAGTDCRSCRHAIQDLVDDAQAAPLACAGGESGASCVSTSSSRSHVAAVG